MKIDMTKVNLLEKDIEDWLYENPSALRFNNDNGPITQWIGRQYQLPSGIADLIGVREDKRLVVIEVKNVAINKAAILQVCRYTSNLKEIVSCRMDYPFIRDWLEPVIDMIVVGPSIDIQTFTEAQAVGVNIFEFSAELSIDFNLLGWTREHHDSTREQHQMIASKPEWSIYGCTIREDIEQHRREKEAKLPIGDDAVMLRGAHLGEGYSDVILTNGKIDDPL